MRITATGSRVTNIGVDVALVTATVYTIGSTKEACFEQAEGTALEVIEQYCSNFHNIPKFTTNLERVRCVDGKGVMSIEYKCVFEIKQAGVDLICGLSELELICLGMCDRIRITDWDIFPSEDVLKCAVDKLIVDAYKDANFDARCALNMVGKDTFEIENVTVEEYSCESLNNHVTLPDPSNTEREILFENINRFVPLTRMVGRRVTLTLIY